MKIKPQKIKKIKPRMVVFTHASNVTGAVNDAKKLTYLAYWITCKIPLSFLFSFVSPYLTSTILTLIYTILTSTILRTQVTTKR